MIPRARRSTFLLTVLLGLAGWWAVERSEPPRGASQRENSPALLSGESFRGELAGGQRRRFPFILGTNRYLRFEVEQRGIDLVVRLLGPDGARIAESDRPVGAWGAEAVSLVSERPGLYILELEPFDANAAAGAFRVTAAEDSLAGARERRRVAGERAIAEGQTLVLAGKYGEGAPLLRQGLEAVHDTGDATSEIDARLGLIAVATAGQRHDEAQEELEIALRLARSLGDLRREAQIHDAFGAILLAAGDRHRALDAYTRALELWQGIPNALRETVDCLTTLAPIYADMGDRRNTDESTRLAVEKARELGDEAGLAVSLLELGSARLWLGDARGAVAPLRETLSLAGRTGPAGQELESKSLAALGAALLQSGRAAQARVVLEQALTLPRQEGDGVWRASNLLQLARTLEGPASWNDRQGLLEQSLQLWRQAGHRGGETACLARLGALDLERGRDAEARRWLEESLRLREEQWRLAPNPTLQAAFLANRSNPTEPYVELLVRSWRSGRGPHDDERAFAAVERARAWGLQRQLLQARYDRNADVPAELLARRRDLGRALFAQTAASPASASRGRRAQELAAALDAVEREIAARSPSLAALMSPKAITLDEARRLLDPDTVLLAYALGEHRSQVFVLSTDSSDIVDLPPRETIEGLARRVAQIVGARNSVVRFENAAERGARILEADRAFMPAALELSRMILGPIAARIAGKRLAVVADGALNSLPWAALPDPEGPRSGAISESPAPLPLAARHEIVYLPSAATLREIRQHALSRPQPSRTLAVIAEPALRSASAAPVQQSGSVTASLRHPQFGLSTMAVASEPAWPALPYASEEARSILEMVDPEDRLSAFGFDASRDLVLGPELGHYRILHFATHANIDNEEPERSGLVLSEVDEQGDNRNGLLGLFDIYHARLPAVELVVLSGCRTALGQELRGEGLVGVARAFMFAGAPRVAVTLWDVEDRATAELMKRFYAALLGERRTPAAALREAQLAMARSAEWSQPYYWAGFVLQGDWR